MHRARDILSCLLLPLLVLLAGCRTEDEAPAPGGDEEYADAMAREHADDDDEASPAVRDTPAAPVTTTEVTYAGRDEEAVEGYLAVPEGVEHPPGIVVIHEWWGLNDNIRRMADELAGHGYAALAVDLYGGRTASETDQAQEIMRSVMEREDALRANLRGAHEYLVSEIGSERTGVIGWCFGGGWALQTALMVPDLDAAVVYYGRVETSAEDLETLEAPLLGHFGAEDQGIPVDSVRQFEGALDDLEKDATIHVYEGAGHAFANPSGSRYQADAAETAWDRTLAFLEEHLKGEAEGS